MDGAVRSVILVSALEEWRRRGCHMCSRESLSGLLCFSLAAEFKMEARGEIEGQEDDGKSEVEEDAEAEADRETEAGEGKMEADELPPLPTQSTDAMGMLRHGNGRAAARKANEARYSARWWCHAT